jgi:AAHS family 4-hydroxybenzoate transporter-like MFS transporter
MTYVAQGTLDSTSDQSSLIDLSQLLDFGQWSALQKAIALLSALAIVFDGMDIQMMGFAIPAMAKDWGVARSAFTSILALGLFGVALGTAFGGLLGDRFGRRSALIANVALFGAATLGIAFTHSLTTLLILRLIAGAGIGGALPNATTLTAEFTPLSKRPLAVTLAIVCIPVGGVLAGLIAAHVLSAGSWRTLFWIGGLSPILLAVALTILLPESPKYMARHSNQRAKLIELLRRIGRPVPGNAQFREPVQFKGDGKGIGIALFGPGQLRNTLPLWTAFFLCLISVYLVFNWLPSLLTGHGLDIKVASEGLAAYNFGGIFGAISFAWWIGKRGSRVPLLVSSAAGVATALVLRVMPIGTPGNHTVLLGALAAHGLFVNATQTTMYALAAHIYTTRVRATGVAAALAVGRTGAILSAYLGSHILRLGSDVYFNALAIGMTGCFVALLVLKTHIDIAPENAQPG